MNTNEQKTWYLAMAPHYWGRAHTIAQAKEEMRKAGGRGSKQWVVYQMPPGADKPTVDEIGQISWTWLDGADQSKTAEVVERRGVK